MKAALIAGLGRLRASKLVVRGGILAGLIEGLAIAYYDVGLAEPAAVAQSCAWLLAIIALSVSLWCVPALLLPTGIDPVARFGASFCSWAAVIAIGRALLEDRTQPGTWILLGAAMVILWLGVRTRARLRNASLVAFTDLCVVLAGMASLWGRVPDVATPFPELALFWMGVIGSAVLSTALVPRYPRIALGGALAAGALVPLLAEPPSAGERGPNVLFVLVDTLRADHVRPFGELTDARAIEKLASEGVTFEDAITVVPKTPASVASFLTGRYPPGHGVRNLYDPLAESNRTLSEMFADAGYQTAALLDNAWLNPARGFAQGFARFDGYFEINAPYGPLRYLSWFVLADRLTLRRIPSFEGQTSARMLTDRALEYLRRYGDRRFFLYVHYFEPHWPYFPPAELARHYGAPPDGDVDVNFVERTSSTRGEMIFRNSWADEVNESGRRLYRGEVHDTLEEIGRLFDELDAMDFGDDTIVVFTADHGHALGDHDYYFHHGEFLYESSLRIPLVLRWPGHLPAGRVVDAQVRSVDVAPTLLDLAGLPAMAESDGLSLAPLWSGDAAQRDRASYVESDVTMFRANDRRPVRGTPGKLRALRDGRFKLILTPSREGARLELYDVDGDPLEANDLAAAPAHAALASAMRERLLQLMPEGERSPQVSRGDPPVQPRSDELELLRRLGYVE